jgi:hypothetical protein
MDEKEDILPMDQTGRPELVTEPRLKEEPEPAVEPAPIDEREGQPRDESGKFASKEKKGVEPEAEQPKEPVPPTGELPQDVYEPLKAVRNENKELKAQLEAMRQQFERQQPKEAPPPQFWDDPDKAFDARFQKLVPQIVQQLEQRQTVQRIEASEAAARAKHADFADALGAFQQAVQHSPALIQQMQAASDPGEFAYSTGKRAMELEKVGSIDELLKAERAKWEAEAKAQMPEPRFPRSTVNDGSVSRQSMVLPTGDDPVLPMDRTR